MVTGKMHQYIQYQVPNVRYQVSLKTVPGAIGTGKQYQFEQKIAEKYLEKLEWKKGEIPCSSSRRISSIPQKLLPVPSSNGISSRYRGGQYSVP